MAKNDSGYDPATTGRTFGNKLTSYLDSPAPVYSNPAAQNGLAGALESFGSTAAGGAYGLDDPGYAAIRERVGRDAMTATNAAFNSSGLFGSDQNQRAAGEGVASALAGLDYANHQSDIGRQSNAASTLSGLLATDQALWDQGQNADYNRFRELLGMYAGSSEAPGLREELPLWEKLLGYGIAATGAVGSRVPGG